MKIYLRKEPGDDLDDINRKICEGLFYFKDLSFISWRSADENLEGMSIYTLSGTSQPGVEAKVKEALDMFSKKLETEHLLARKTELKLEVTEAASA